MKSGIKTVLVGERTNVTGSALFRSLIHERKFEEAVKTGERQIKDGARMLDICFITSKDERGDMMNFLAEAVKKIDAPFMIDSLSGDVIEAALEYAARKCVINSVNVGNSEQKLEKVVKIALKYNAPVVVGTINKSTDGGMAVKREDKLEVAKRSIEILSGRYGLKASDIIFDPLLFPVTSKPEGRENPAEETVEGLRLIKESFPETKTLLGLSNISFGLPVAARAVIESVFLYYAESAGLDLAITDPGRLYSYSEIEPSLRNRAENLIFLRGVNPRGKFLSLFKN